MEIDYWLYKQMIMKRLTFFASVMLAVMVFFGCNQNTPDQKSPKGIKVIDKQYAESYYGYAEISVPAGVTTVYMENYAGLDAQGNKKNLKVTPIRVNPIVETPKDGKDVEPFGKVKLLFEAPAQTMVAVYYVAGNGAEHYSLDNHGNYAPARFAEEDPEERIEEVYSLNDFPVDQITSGQFGQTRYVQVQWNFAWENSPATGNVNAKTFPKDVVLYDADHDHTLRYKFAYDGGGFAGYFLEDAYTVENYIVVARKYSNSCGHCGEGCPYCMPWGCSCGCGGTVNPNFHPNGNLLASATDAEVIEEPTDVPALAPVDVTVVKLQEPAPYVTSDEDQTFYHSSGCVFFEDSWPTINQGGVYDTDFDDCVIDYDIEAKTVADELLESQGYREQVKVVLHLRAVGSDLNNGPYRVGLKLEGFDTENVEYIEQFFTLDSWQNPHGELPAFTETTIQRNSGHYEGDKQNPIVEMAHIFTMNQERAGVGANAEYTYVNGSFTNHTVFNLTFGFKGGPDDSQYDPALASITSPTTLAAIQNQKFYNVIPGYINVAGGLVTQTVIYHMKPRAEMSPAERDAVKANMIASVMETTKQNFYIIKKDFTPIGLKGYEPVMLHNESVNPYNTKYNNGVTNGSLDSSIPYYGTNGTVWGFKCPTLTRHIWNKLYFSQAYPHYEEWVTSKGASHANWYNEDVDDLFLTCWW